MSIVDCDGPHFQNVESVFQNPVHNLRDIKFGNHKWQAKRKKFFRRAGIGIT